MKNYKIEIIELLIKNKVNINSLNLDGFTPLHIACYYDFYLIVKLLIKNGADINSNENPKKLKPIDVARNQKSKFSSQFLN